MENDIDKKSYISDNQTRPIEFKDNILAWIDEDTGLMWEVKNIDNIKHGYVWSKNWIKEAHIPKNLTDDVKDAFSYVEKLNKTNYVGFKDWRLPTKEELETIVTKELSKTKGFDDRYSCIKEPLSKNTEWCYWSSSPDEHDVFSENGEIRVDTLWSSTDVPPPYSVIDLINGWKVSFFNGCADKSLKGNVFYVRCVRNLRDEEK